MARSIIKSQIRLIAAGRFFIGSTLDTNRFFGGDAKTQIYVLLFMIFSRTIPRKAITCDFSLAMNINS
ncbi:MAG: hypothetical protein ACNY01_12850, partial [Desulfobacteria bacterium]